MAACAACGFENADTAKFCSECGAALGGVAATRREERKVVSVVFTDLVGSTARAEESDPEDVRALLRVYHEQARDELERFGGTVEKFIGDAVVAVFGAPVAHEDDPERAVRAAIAVRDAVAGLNDAEPGRDLHVRIAVNTGEALVSLDAQPGEGEGMVAGDVMNTAARLQSAAPVDGILVGEQTYRATEREIVYREAEPVEAKGKAQPVPVWEAVEPRARLGVDLGGAGGAALVGREEELDLLADALRRARRDEATQLVTLVGVPGIGKSRLVYELAKVVDADPELITWRQGRSLPYGEGVTYWALGEIVKAQAGVLESDPADVTEAKLIAALASLPDDGERAWVERHLRPLVGLGRVDGRGDDRGEAFAAWRRFLESLAAGGPMVLVFEDIHWADDGLLDFVDGLVEWVDRVPLLVVCTARPELLERRPDWGGGKRNATTVSLAELDVGAIARLVGALLERPLMDAETQQALVDRAGGNPLYAEEYVRMLQAGGAVDRGLPETVQGIIAARIDLLPPEEKSLLQTAAVHGKVFWSDALATTTDVEPWRLSELLRSLERKEFVRRERSSAVAGASQHAFVHALVRDAAYGQLPRATRADRHLAAAAWIESLPDDRAGDRAETLAHHYLTVIELRHAAGDDVTDIGPSAVSALAEAGARALGLNAFHAAGRYLARALELLPAGAEPPPELLFDAGRSSAHLGGSWDDLARSVDAFERAGNPERAAEAAAILSWHAWHTQPVEALRWLERAAALVDGRPTSRAKALVLAEQARRAMVGFRYATAIELADRAIAEAREIGDVVIEADALVSKAGAVAGGGDRDAIAMYEHALELVGHSGRVAGRAYTNLGSGWHMFGELRRSREATLAGIEVADREGELQSAWFMRMNLVGTQYALGDWDAAWAGVAEVMAAPEGLRPGTLVLQIRALLLEARGSHDEALAAFAEAFELARQHDDPQEIWPMAVSYGGMLRRQARAAEAAAMLDEVVDAIRGSESVGDTQDWHVELMLELRETGRAEAAAAIAARMPDGAWADAARTVVDGEYLVAADRLESIGEQPLQAQLRMLAASSLATAGLAAAAAEQLERAKAFYRRAGATTFLARADGAVAAAG